jgi:hypothetical protein
VSTKAIREALKWLNASERALENEDMQAARTAALAEVEAIERAAKTIAACDLVYPRHVANEIDRASETMLCIAKEAP